MLARHVARERATYIRTQTAGLMAPPPIYEEECPNDCGVAPARPDRGLIKLRCRTYNQNGKVVQDMTATLLVARRPV